MPTGRPQLVDHRENFVDRSLAGGRSYAVWSKILSGRSRTLHWACPQSKDARRPQDLPKPRRERKGLAADIERAEASLEKLNEQGFRRSPTYPYDW